jgi:hypothetical protein
MPHGDSSLTPNLPIPAIPLGKKNLPITRGTTPERFVQKEEKLSVFSHNAEAT